MLRCCCSHMCTPAPHQDRTANATRRRPLPQRLSFEAYRDLIRLLARGASEEQGLAAATADLIALRASREALQAAADKELADAKRRAGAAAAAAPRVNLGVGTSANTMPLGRGGSAPGIYSAMGFSYGSNDPVAAAQGGGGGGLSDDDDGSEDSEGEEEGAAPATAAEEEQEAEDERVDELAESVFGVPDFAYTLHRALQQEDEDEARMRAAPR